MLCYFEHQKFAFIFSHIDVMLFWAPTFYPGQCSKSTSALHRSEIAGIIKTKQTKQSTQIYAETCTSDRTGLANALDSQSRELRF